MLRAGLSVKNILHHLQPKRHLMLTQATALRSRNLFCDTFHLVDVTAQQIHKEKLVNKDPWTFKQEMRKSIYKSETQQIVADDMVKFFLLCEGERDLDFALTLLNRAISEDLRTLGYCEKTFEHIWLYFKICYIQNLPNQAAKAWTDPTIRSTSYTLDRSRLSRLYFDLLFRNNMFQHVLFNFNRDVDYLVTKFDCVKLTCLACYKLGTKSALLQGLNILAHPACVIDTINNRSYQAVALLAYNLKEFHIAYDLLVKYGTTNKRSPFFVKSLMLMVLSDLGWFKESILLIDSQYDGRGQKFSYFAVEKLLKEAQMSDSKTGSQMEKKIKQMKLLPSNYELDPEVGLEQMLLKEILPSTKHSKSPATPFVFSL